MILAYLHTDSDVTLARLSSPTIKYNKIKRSKKSPSSDVTILKATSAILLTARLYFVFNRYITVRIHCQNKRKSKKNDNMNRPVLLLHLSLFGWCGVVRRHDDTLRSVVHMVQREVE